MSATPLEAAALAAVDEAAVVELARRLIRCPGQNPPGEEAQRVAELVAACSELGLSVRTDEAAPGRENVHARTVSGAGNGPGVLILGHTDVVPVGDGWSLDPFGAVLRDGRIYGRGACDMLGGLAAAVMAAHLVGRAARTTGTALSGPVEVAATVDEEESGLGIRRLMSGLRETYLGCITAEPTDLQTIVAARGDCYLDITIDGLAAHAGRPGDGRNAIYGAAAVVDSLRHWHGELADAAHPLAGPATWSVGQIHGGQGTAIVPARCVVQADRRLLPGEDPAEVLAAVRDRLAGLGLERSGLSWSVDMPMSMPGFETSASSPFSRLVDGALAESGGPGLPVGGWTASCDGGYLARDAGVPTVVLGPGSVNDQAHRPDESVAVRELLIATRTYVRVACRLLGPPAAHAALSGVTDHGEVHAQHR